MGLLISELPRQGTEFRAVSRTGLEDNVRLDKDRLAPSNAALVERAVEIAQEAGRSIATVSEARKILDLSTSE